MFSFNLLKNLIRDKLYENLQKFIEMYISTEGINMYLNRSVDSSRGNEKHDVSVFAYKY